MNKCFEVTPKRTMAGIAALLLAAVVPTVAPPTVAHAQSAKCEALKQQMDQLGSGGVITGDGAIAAGYLVLYAQYKAYGCDASALGPPDADLRAGDQFQLPDPNYGEEKDNGGSWYMRVQHNTKGLESWSHYLGVKKNGYSSTFKLGKVYVAYPDQGVFHAQIEVADGPDKGSCLGLKDHEVHAMSCEAGRPTEWSIYAHGKRYSMNLQCESTNYDCAMGFAAPHTSEPGYGGYADVWKSNTRTWKLVKAGGH
ncbi:hypothetical protein [Streptomyces noursei]|uniref:hypothetical protein n=1 Tax=Streptomyces noursei TaxID=1971 RepID=UPI0035DEDAF2